MINSSTLWKISMPDEVELCLIPCRFRHSQIHSCPHGLQQSELAHVRRYLTTGMKRKIGFDVWLTA